MDLGLCQLDPVRRTFTGPAGTARLSKSECGLLSYLAARPDKPVSKSVLLREVWGYATGVRSRTVDTTANRLRAKIEVDPSAPVLLRTFRGRGLAFCPGPRITRPTRALVGRSEEQSTIAEHLERGAAGLLTLVGPPGVGKTALARWAAAERGVAVVECRTATTPQALGALVLQALGPSARRSPFDATSLLVLDNLEQLVAGARKQVEAWAEAGPVLATSQRRLDTRSEATMTIGPLKAVDARTLLRERMPPDLQLPSKALDGVVEGCDGLPLELELLGRAIPRFGVDTLSEVSALRLRAEAGGWDLTLAMDWSWSLLTESAARTLRHLSVFNQDFDLQAAAAVLDVAPFELLELLSELHERSLVAGDQGVFRLLGVVRDSARQRLRQAGEHDAATLGLVRWCTSLWEDYVRHGPSRVQRHHLDILAVVDAVPDAALGPLVAAWIEGIAIPTGIEVEHLARRANAATGANAAFLWAACHDAARLAGDQMAAGDARRALLQEDIEAQPSVARCWVLGRTDPGAHEAMAGAWDAAPDHQRGYFIQRLPVEARRSRLPVLLATCQARGWTYAATSVRALLGAAAFESGAGARAIALLQPEDDTRLASFRAFYRGMAQLDLGRVDQARASFAAGRHQLPRAYAARCAALQLTVDLAAGRDLDFSDPLIERFHVGPLAALLRALAQPSDPEHAERVEAWRAGPTALDRSSFLAYAEAWLRIRAQEQGTPLPR